MPKMWAEASMTEVDNLVSEKALESYVKELAELYGWSYYHQVTGVICPSCHKPTFSKREGPGFPDLVLAHPNGRLIFAELKSQKGKLREGQPEWLALLNTGRGREVYLWRPSDMDTIALILQPTYDGPTEATLELPDRSPYPSTQKETQTP